MSLMTRLAVSAVVIWLASAVGGSAETTPDKPADCPASVNKAYRYVAKENLTGQNTDNQPSADQTAKAEAPTEVGLGDVLVLEVANLPSLYTPVCGGGGTKQPVLFVNGRPLIDHFPDPRSSPQKGKLFFTLTRTDKSRDMWSSLLGRPKFATRAIDVSVGYPEGFALPSQASLELRAISGRQFLLWLIVFIVMTVAFLLTVRHSNILRNDPVNVGAPQPAQGPYSLARAQAAWWFFLIMAAYLFIGIVTGDFLNSLNATALSLLAIGAAAVVGSVTIDSSNSDKTEQDRLAKIAKAKADLDSATTANNQSAIKEAQKRYEDLTKPSQNFLLDVISDYNGVVFHRFQVVAWTAVLGVVFILAVYHSLAMADFSGTLLGLQGIS